MIEKINEIFSKNISAFEKDVILVRGKLIEYLEELPKDSFAETQYLEIEIENDGTATIGDEVLFKEIDIISKDYIKKVLNATIRELDESLKDAEKVENNQFSKKLEKIEIEEQTYGYTITIPALF